MRTGRKSNNGGFSLVELIIVIAIMAILVGVMAISASSLTGRKVKKCADEIVSTIERTRVLTLGKEQNDVECVLTYEGKEYHAKIYQKGTLVSDRIVGKDPIDIKVYFEDGASATGYTLAKIDGKTPYATPGEKVCIWYLTGHPVLLSRIRMRPVDTRRNIAGGLLLQTVPEL